MRRGLSIELEVDGVAWFDRVRGLQTGLIIDFDKSVFDALADLGTCSGRDHLCEVAV